MVSYFEPPLQVVTALVRLDPRSQKNLAGRIGLDAANFSAALAGRKPFPPERLGKLLGELGVANGVHADRARVLTWQIGLRLDDLRVATGYLFPHGASYGGVWRVGAGPYDLSRVLDLPLIAITDNETRAIVVSRNTFYGTPEPVNEATVPALRKRLGIPAGTKGAVTMMSIPGEKMKRWARGEVTADEFDAVVNASRQDRVTPTKRSGPRR